MADRKQRKPSSTSYHPQLQNLHDLCLRANLITDLEGQQCVDTISFCIDHSLKQAHQRLEEMGYVGENKVDISAIFSASIMQVFQTGEGQDIAGIILAASLMDKSCDVVIDLLKEMWMQAFAAGSAFYMEALAHYQDEERLLSQLHIPAMEESGNGNEKQVRRLLPKVHEQDLHRADDTARPKAGQVGTRGLRRASTSGKRTGSKSGSTGKRRSKGAGG